MGLTRMPGVLRASVRAISHRKGSTLSMSLSVGHPAGAAPIDRPRQVSFSQDPKAEPGRGEARQSQVPTALAPDHFGAFFAGAVERLLRGLYVRSSRRALCRSEAWIVPQAWRPLGLDQTLVS